MALVAVAVLGVVALAAVHFLRGSGQTPEEQNPTALSAANAENADTTVAVAQPTSSKTEAQAVSRPAEPAALPAVKGKPVTGNPASTNTSPAKESKQSKTEPRGESRNKMIEEAKKKKAEQIQSTETEVEGLD